jgi:branched-subunit amino acid transport protein
VIDIGNMGLVLVVAVGAYGTRVTGFSLGRLTGGGGRALPPAFDRFLSYVPIAAFAALIVPDLVSGPGDLSPRLLGVLAAALAVWRTEKLWAGLLLGMAAFWAAQFVLLGGM